jgi:hypothetical protein
LEPAGHSPGSARAGKSVLLSELRELARPGRCLVVYHHHTRREGGHLSEIEYWADRLRNYGFTTVDALRARPYSPRVFFLLDVPNGVRQRAEQIERNWEGLITWHPDGGQSSSASEHQPLSELVSPMRPIDRNETITSPPQERTRPRGNGRTTEEGYVNRNSQEVVRPTGKPGTDHGQYIYVLRCRTCGHEYGANGSDIWLRRCPAHDRGASGLAL